MAEPAVTTGHRTAPLQILVYGSDAMQRRLVARAFALHRITVLLASSVAEAAKCIRDGALHAAVLLDEIAVLHAVHALQPTLPVLWAGAVSPTALMAVWCSVIDTNGGAPDADAIVHATLRMFDAIRRP